MKAQAINVNPVSLDTLRSGVCAIACRDESPSTNAINKRYQWLDLLEDAGELRVRGPGVYADRSSFSWAAAP